MLDVDQRAELLHIRIENEIAPGARSKEAVAKVEAIKAKIASGEYLKIVSSEGGTGLIKIRKILGVRDRPSSQYDFGFDDRGHFYIELSLRTREISRCKDRREIDDAALPDRIPDAFLGLRARLAL